MYKEILIDVTVNDINPYMKDRVLHALDRATGIHRVEQLGGVVYRGFVDELDLDDPESDDLWYAFHRCEGCKVYVKGDMNFNDIYEMNKILKRRKWNGHSFVTTMGPV